MNPDEQRRRSAEMWEEAAPGWVRHQALMREFGAPVSMWMVAAIDPQPGQRVLELAAGLGDTGMLVAELLAPGGSVILSDQAEGMLAGARARVRELGLTNVEIRTFVTEWIDLSVASVDSVLCRWGLMLMVDPGAALLEARRVLRPGGRLALAVWDALERNPWADLPRLELRERGLASAPAPGAPGPFALGDRERVGELLREAGFVDVRLDALDLVRRHRSFDDFWETSLDLSRNIHDAVLGLPAAEIADVRDAVAARLAPHTAADGSLAIPGRTLVASALA